MLKKAFQQFQENKFDHFRDEYYHFLNEHGWWLNDYAFFISARDYFGGNPEVDEAIEMAIAKMRALGATFVEFNVPKDIRNAWQGQMELVIDREIAPQLSAYLNTVPGAGPKSLEDLIKGLMARSA